MTKAKPPSVMLVRPHKEAWQLTELNESIANNMPDRQTESALSESIRKEQDYVSMLYALLDAARERSDAALREVHGRGGAGGTFAARVEREVSAAEQARRLSQLNGV